MELRLGEDLEEAVAALKVDAFDGGHHWSSLDPKSGKILDKAES